MGRNLKELGESDTETGNRETEQPTGLNHNLPDTAKPFLFLFHPQTFYVTAAEQTNLYVHQKITAKGPDSIY